MVDQRDTADVRFAHMEKRANKDEVPAQESSELPCSEASLIGLESVSYTHLTLPTKA